MNSLHLKSPPAALWQEMERLRWPLIAKQLDLLASAWQTTEDALQSKPSPGPVRTVAKTHPAPAARARVFTPALKEATAEVVAHSALAPDPTAVPARSADGDSRTELMELIARDAEQEIAADIANSADSPSATAVALRQPPPPMPTSVPVAHAPALSYRLLADESAASQLDSIYFADAGESGLKQLTEQLARKLGAQSAALLLHDPLSRVYRIIASWQWDELSERRFVISPGDEYISPGATEQSLMIGEDGLVDHNFRKRFGDEFWRLHRELRLFNLQQCGGDGFMAFAYHRRPALAAGWSDCLLPVVKAVLPAAERLARARWRRPESAVQDRTSLELILAQLHRLAIISGGRMSVIYSIAPALLEHSDWRSIQADMVLRCLQAMDRVERAAILAPHRWLLAVRPQRVGVVRDALRLALEAHNLEGRVHVLQYPDDGRNFYNYVMPEEAVL